MRTTRPVVLYRDRLIECTTEALIIHGYYFPLGTKKIIPYNRIRGIQEIEMGALTGKGRIWGSGDLKHWWHLDPGRLRKQRALILDVGSFFVPIITPNDTTQVKTIVESWLARR
jgi:hypothetical protein